MLSLQWEPAPPDSGLILIESLIPPVSLQGSSTRQAHLRDTLRAQIARCPFLLTGEVKVWIEWQADELIRYETAESADVDNVIKPILDALSGPEGLLIDDSQVQTIGCHWQDQYSDSERFSVELKFDPEAFCDRARVVFVEIAENLCFPISTANPEAQRRIAYHAARMFRTRDRLLKAGATYEIARGVLPLQRPFHRQRVERFPIVTLGSLGPDPEPELGA
jgi:Holliday junction resolvase RusA-like endonuclease